MPSSLKDNSPFNRRFFAERMDRGRIIAVISNEALLDLVLGGYEPLVAGYVDHITYPLEDRDDLLKMAKFRSINHPTDGSDEPWGHLEIGADYLSYVKQYLLELAQRDGAHPETLRLAKYEQDRLDASEFADRLGYPILDDDKTGPLGMLADLPVPIIMTTCCHTFIEAALRRAGKEPRSDFCRWHSELDGSRSVFSGGYEPSAEQPLVYHLHGLDAEKGSLVLAEDDYLDFLVAITQNLGNDRDRIPGEIRAAMQQSALVLLGFELHSWAFRVFLWGLIKYLRTGTKGLVTLQIAPNEMERAFLSGYFKHEASLDIHWGSVLECIQRLHAQWRP